MRFINKRGAVGNTSFGAYKQGGFSIKSLEWSAAKNDEESKKGGFCSVVGQTKRRHGGMDGRMGRLNPRGGGGEAHRARLTIPLFSSNTFPVGSRKLFASLGYGFMERAEKRIGIVKNTYAPERLRP